MSFNVVDKPEIQLLGYNYWIPMEKIGTSYISDLWNALEPSKMNNLIEKSNGLIPGIVGVSTHMDDKGFEYWIAVASDSTEEGTAKVCVLPPASWTVVEVIGAMRPQPLKLFEAYEKLFKEWLPSSKYEHAGIAEIEYYPMMGEDMFREDYKTEIWVSVKNKDI